MMHKPLLQHTCMVRTLYIVYWKGFYHFVEYIVTHNQMGCFEHGFSHPGNLSFLLVCKMDSYVLYMQVLMVTDEPLNRW